MKGLIFTEPASRVVSHPNRMDIACFVGFVNRRTERRDGVDVPTPIPGVIQQWLRDFGWLTPPYARPQSEIDQLEDVPVLIDNWATFDALFDWDARLLNATDALPSGATYLGTAVRSFFEQGGRRCYVVRVGDPLPFNTLSEDRLEAINLLLPGYRANLLDASKVDPHTWHGAAHLYGLPDVTFVNLPDLPDLVALDPQPLDPEREREIPEQFVECSENTIDDTVDAVSDQIAAPRCDETGYSNWARALRLLGLMLRDTQREVQLVAAIPLPADRANTDLLDDLFDGPLRYSVNVPESISSAFIQLVFPWLQTRGSSGLPEQLESAEGTVVGTLARQAMTQGAFRSAVSAPLVDVYRLEPIPALDMLYRERGADAMLFIDRVTVVGPRAAGRFELFSDVTTSLDPSYRPANINRLIASVVRAARRIGESSVFEPSSPVLWGQLEERMRSLLSGLEQAGALLETDDFPAFEVRCDRSTMTQTDIDAGRVIVQVVLNAAQPVQTIRVELSVNAGGEVLVVRDDLFRKDTA